MIRAHSSVHADNCPHLHQHWSAARERFVSLPNLSDGAHGPVRVLMRDGKPCDELIPVPAKPER